MKFKVLIRLFLVYALCLTGHTYAQCTACTYSVTNNSTTNYTVVAGQKVCVGTGVNYLGTITLNGGTICNYGNVSKVTFLKGTFNNYTSYISLGNISISASGSIIFNCYGGSKTQFTGNLDYQSTNSPDSLVFNVYEGCYCSVDKTLSGTKGNLNINYFNTQKGYCSFNIKKDLNIGNTCNFRLNLLNPSGVFNVAGTMGFDNKGNKTIYNYGTFNIGKSFNIGGTGLTTSLITILNSGNLNIGKFFTISYNTGIVNVTNYAQGKRIMQIGDTYTQSKATNNFTNNGTLLISKDLNVELGSFTNNLGLQARDINVKQGTFTNSVNAKVTASRDLLTSTASGSIKNNGSIYISHALNNKGTITLGITSVINTLDLYNLNGGLITGPPDILSDSTNYAYMEVARTSNNAGTLANYIWINDLTNTNAGVKLDVYQNNSVKLGFPKVIFGSAHLCYLNALNLGITTNGKDDCVGQPAVLNAFAYNTLSQSAVAVNSYTWKPGNVVTATGSLALTFSATTLYTVTAILSSGCLITNTLLVNVTPMPVISYTGSPFNQNITATVNVTQTLATQGHYTASPAGLMLNVSTGAIVPSQSAVGIYTVTYVPTSNNCNYNITTVVEIKVDCDFTLMPSMEIQLCEGTTLSFSLQSTAVLQYSWTPSTGLSCTSCSNPVITATPGIPQYTVYAYNKGYKNVSCNSKIVYVTVKQGCNTITGCCFSNYGAAVYLASQSTYVNVYCNLVNELGQFSNGNIKKGEFVNKGKINVKLDWIHNAKNDLYLTNQGESNFFGANQSITGNSNTHFNRIDLTGNGIKTIWLDEYAHADMNLTSNELFVQNNTFFMKNSTAGISNNGGGFVSTLTNGYLSRTINSKTVIPVSAPYFYPMGSRAMAMVPSSYRPVEIYNSNVAEELSVNFMNIPPSFLTDISFAAGSNVSSIAPNVSTINNLYYHKIKKTLPSTTPSTLTIRSYFPPVEGTYQSLAEWEKDPAQPDYWWGSTPGSAGSSVPSVVPQFNGLINALTNGEQTFNGTPFTLAKSGAYVGTGDFGGSGTTISITSPGYPSGTSGNGLNTPIPIGPGAPGTGTSVVTPSVVAVDYVVNIAPTDECTLPGKIKFTVNTNGSITPTSVLFGLAGATGYLGPLSADVYTIDNLNSGLILHSVPKNILTECMNGVKVGTSVGNDFIVTPGESIIVTLPAVTGGGFGQFALYSISNSTTPVFTSPGTLSAGSTGFSPSLINGVYNFKINVTVGFVTDVVKGQLIVK